MRYVRDCFYGGPYAKKKSLAVGTSFRLKFDLIALGSKSEEDFDTKDAQGGILIY